MDWIYLINVLTEYILPLLYIYFLPWITEVINLKETSPKNKYWIALIVCLLLSLIHNLDVIYKGSWQDVGWVLGFFGVIFTFSQTIYRQHFNESKFQAWINKKFGEKVVA